MEAYVHGVSTRSVDDLVAALGGTGISKSEVSRICAGLDETVGAFRTRTLGHTASRTCSWTRPTCTCARARAGRSWSKAVVVATGVTEHGTREILGLDVGDSEDETFWRKFLTDLKDRGLSGVMLVISDQHAGLVKALAAVLRRRLHQRCRVHFARNLLALVPKSHKDMVAALFRTIFAQPDAEAVHAAWDQVRDQLAAKAFPKIGP
jgi:putative transposase